jgi:DNA topoisomerase I
METALPVPPATSQPIFDITRARATIEKGRRSKWWSRKGSMKKGFYYVDTAMQRIADPEKLDRIKSLVIPPAWKHVRISPTAGSRIQAVGMDGKGRVQYLYNGKFAERQQRKKFERIEEFGKYLPRLRQVTNEHLRLEGFPREKVLAVMIRLINSLYFRVGTEKSAKHYRTYGITTLKNKHLRFGRNDELIFDYVGKSHVKHRKVLVDEELAAVMKELKGVGGTRKLFHFLNCDGRPCVVKPQDINNYLKEATAHDFTAKDFRTWGASLLAAAELAEIGPTDHPRQIKKNIVHTVKKVAEDLGNTPTVCRSSYIHPVILQAYEKGITIESYRPRKERRITRMQADYEPEEIALLRLFKEHSPK